MKQRLDKLLSNLGYCSRSEVGNLIRKGLVEVSGEPARSGSEKVDPSTVTVEGEALDPPSGIILMLHKPAGYVCSRNDAGEMIYELLPARWNRRNPALATIGRLDKDTTGLILFTDDGKLLQKIVSPKSKLKKIYEVELAENLRGDEAEVFGSGSLVLDGEDKPLLPAEFEARGQKSASLRIYEGRYHQVKRMFAAVGNAVTKLHRSQIGGLTLEDLPEGEYRLLNEADLARLFDSGR